MMINDPETLNVRGVYEYECESLFTILSDQAVGII
jgi:hypothetical protein